MSAAVATVATGSTALLLGLLLTEPLRRFAVRHGITDRPNGRKGHSRPTPYLGGIAVAAATLAAGTTGALFCGAFEPALGVLLGSAAIVALLGLTDDLRPLGAGIRLLVETSTASVVVLVGGHPTVFDSALDGVLAVLWIVFMTNAFNLLDNMDGAASSLCTVIGGFTCLVALFGGLNGLGMVMAALAGSCVGFLFHNWHPARIFLGDAGSLFLGFTLASAMVVLQADGPGLSGPTSLLLATMVPTVDTALVLLSRFRESRPLLQGGTDHMAHRLRRMGLTARQTVGFLSVFAALSCLSGVLVMLGFLAPGVVLLVAAPMGIGMVALLLKVPAMAVSSPWTVVPGRSPATSRRSYGGPAEARYTVWTPSQAEPADDSAAHQGSTPDHRRTFPVGRQAGDTRVTSGR